LRVSPDSDAQRSPAKQKRYKQSSAQTGGIRCNAPDWGQSTTVTCNGADSTGLMQALFNADNWGTLVFDKADALGQ
jgi:hypothetical protein